MKRLIIRVVAILAILEFAYVAVANVALNLPATQTFINDIRPDRYIFHWERAWSWHPFRVHATGFSANGQTASQQWQVSAPAIAASIAILPLLGKTAHFYNLDTANIDVRTRPRPSPDRDDAAIRKYYPPIDGRAPNLVATTPPSQMPGWKLVFDIGAISGQNEVWVWQTRATLVGTGRATVVHQGKHGPLTVAGGEMDATVRSLTIAGEEVSKSGDVKGKFDIATFIPHQNRGLKSLAFVSLDADIDLPVAGLDSLNFYLGRVSGMNLGGDGALKGHVAYDKGKLTAGTDLTIAAGRLTVDQPPYRADGAGEVAIKVDAANPDTLVAGFHFTTLSALHEPDHGTLFTGTNLEIGVERTTRILPGGDEERFPLRVVLTIPAVKVPDLKSYQGYLPDKWRLQVVGGAGSLEGRAEISAARIDFDLTLRSENASIAFKDDSFATDLVMGIKAKGTSAGDAAEIDFSGTYLDLDDSRLKIRNGDNSDPWRTRFSVTKGEGQVAVPRQAAVGAGGFWSLFQEKDLKGMLATADGRLQADLAVSDLNWVNLLLKNPYALAIYNSAEVEADLTVRSGWLAEGSAVRMAPRDFKVEVLDYVAEGVGGFDLSVQRGGEEPDIRLDANLESASLRLADEKAAVIDQMTLAVTATAKNVSLRDGGSVAQLDLTIPSAKVTDMAAYNVYLPEGSPVSILGGRADFRADIKVREDRVGGSVKVQTSRVDADIDGQRISGTLAANLVIKDGSAKGKTFDISGSSVRLDGVRVAGDNSAKNNWSARADIGKGSVVWKKPMNLDFNAAVRMTDTRPLIAIFQADRETHKWLDNILTLKDVLGQATIRVRPKELVVPYALFTSDTIEVGAKGVFRKNDRRGIFYARYGKLAGILEVDNDRKHFGLIGATRKFESYVPGGGPRGLHDSGSSKAPTKEKRSPFSIFERR